MSINKSLSVRLGIGLFLIAITWAVFGQTFHHQFVNYDDPLYVYENSHVRAGLSWQGVGWAFTHVHSQNWHPLTTISHMLDCQLFGVNPGPQHLVNVFWHTVAALLLFIFLLRATARVWPSALVAALFSIHPLRVESVAWIAERKDVLSGAFFMMTLLAYWRWTRNQTVGRYLTTAIFFGCGLMAKPMLVTAPLILLLLDYWPFGRMRSAKSETRNGKGRAGILLTSQPLNPSTSLGDLVIEKIPLFALSAGSVVATFWAQNFALGSTEFLPLRWRISNAVFSYFEYVRQMFWPVNLIPFYVHPENRLETWRLAIAILFLAFVTVIAFARRRKNPYLIIGWLWYLVMLVPVIGIVQVGLQGHADRYTYLPQIGLLIALVWLLYDLAQSHAHKMILSVAGVMIVGTLSILSAKQTGYWRDTEALWRHTLDVTPNSDVAHAGLGGILFARGQINDAIDHYETALRLRDGNVAAHFGLARALVAEQKTDAAISHLQKTLEIQPDYIAASNDLGVLLASKGEIKDAIAAWRRTLTFDPGNADASNNIAWVLSTAADADLRNGTEALGLARRAIQTGGENPVVLRTLAAAQAENGQFSEAIETCRRGRELAERIGDQAMAESLRQCSQSFQRGEALRGTQVSH